MKKDYCKDGEVKSYIVETDNDSKKISYVDYNDFNQKVRALRKYCIRSYKDLAFRFFNQKIDLEDGTYEENIMTPKDFKFVYGQIKVRFFVKNGVMVLIDLEPADFFKAGFMKELHEYRGLYYRNRKDIDKIEFYRNFKEKKNGII